VLKNLGGDTKVAALLQDFKCQIGDLRNGPFGEKTAAGKCMLRSLQPPAKKDTGAAPACVPGQPCELKGAKAVIECFELIPCNPCVEACKLKAITMGSELVDLPVFVPDKCTGCGTCLTKCPGLAIFLVNKDYSATEAEVTIPYEFLPVPDKGQAVFAVDKDGKTACKAIVSKVRTGKNLDRKALVSLVVPKECADDVRHFSITEKQPAKFDKKPKSEPSGEVIVCRCEEITRGEIEKEMDAGSDSFDELKRILRCGMGSCQGKGCSRLILGMLSQRFGGAPGTFRPGTQRTPLKPVSLDVLGKD
jgi:Fe-S-cluster-containing hydrogenase component 2